MSGDTPRVLRAFTRRLADLFDEIAAAAARAGRPRIKIQVILISESDDQPVVEPWYGGCPCNICRAETALVMAQLALRPPDEDRSIVSAATRQMRH